MDEISHAEFVFLVKFILVAAILRCVVFPRTPHNNLW